jgi:hypothetical protein
VLALLPLLPHGAAGEPVYTLLHGAEPESTIRFVEDLAHLWRGSNANETSALSGRVETPDLARMQALRRSQAQFAIVDADVLTRHQTGYPDLAAVTVLWQETLHVLARGGDAGPLAALPGGDLLVADTAVYGQAALSTAPGASTAPGRWLLLPRGGTGSALQRRPLPLLLVSGVPPLPEIEQALRENADLRLLSIARPLSDPVRTVSPWLSPTTLRAGTYPGQSQAVETLAVHQVLIARADAPPALVQHALAALFRWQERMAAANPRFAALERKANLPAAAWFPYHAAAVKELGLTLPERPSQ